MRKLFALSLLLCLAASARGQTLQLRIPVLANPGNDLRNGGGHARLRGLRRTPQRLRARGRGEPFPDKKTQGVF